jgi:Flp pilus assembly protein TadD
VKFASLTLAFFMLGSTMECAGAAATAQQRDSARCRSHANLSACYDAVRRSPADAALLASLGDALVRAKRPDDALRNYRRAQELSPNLQGLDAKIGAAQGFQQHKRETSAAKRATTVSPQRKPSTNVDPEAQSH